MGVPRAVVIDLPPLPSPPETFVQVPARVQVRPYAGSASLASWMASRRSVLSVRLTLKAPFSFPVAPGKDVFSIPETCVPADYDWPKISLRWGGLSVQKQQAIFENYEAIFDPKRCAVSSAKRRRFEMESLYSVNSIPFLFGYQTASSFVFFLPPWALLASDTGTRREWANALSVELPKTQEGTLLVGFQSPERPDSVAPFELRINVLPGDSPRLVAWVEQIR